MDKRGNENKPRRMFDGVRTFTATMARDREMLGEKVTDWIRGNPDNEIVDAVVTQSSDEEFHCLAITVFFRRGVAGI
jgi:hypothetical protein